MRAFWVGASSATAEPATSGAQYHLLATNATLAWSTTESFRAQPISEDIVLTRLRVWVSNAPGAGKSWTFTVRDDAADTAATVTISGTDTSATWTGSTATIAALSAVALGCTPAGTPAAPGAVHWAVEYETTGDFYLILGGGGVNTANNTNRYQCPFAITTPSTTEGEHQIIAGTSFTVTKLVARADRAVTGGGGYTVGCRLNGAAAPAAATLNAANQTAAVALSMAFTTYDYMAMGVNTLSVTSVGSIATCLTVVPGVAGEIVHGANTGSPGHPADNSVYYNKVIGVSSPFATESARSLRFPACVIKRLSVRQDTAPGTGKSRAYTIRGNGADISAPVLAADTANSFSAVGTIPVGDGDLLTVATVGSGTPAASPTKMSLITTMPVTAGSDTTNFFF